MTGSPWTNVPEVSSETEEADHNFHFEVRNAEALEGFKSLSVLLNDTIAENPMALIKFGPYRVIVLTLQESDKITFDNEIPFDYVRLYDSLNSTKFVEFNWKELANLDK